MFCLRGVLWAYSRDPSKTGEVAMCRLRGSGAAVVCPLCTEPGVNKFVSNCRLLWAPRAPPNPVDALDDAVEKRTQEEKADARNKPK